MLTREDVREKARQERVKFLRLQFTDIFGTFKNIALTLDDLEQAMAGRISFDSSVVDGLVNSQERAIILQPDLSTFLVLPWRPREEAVARFICDVLNPDGTPYPGCSRNVLKKVLAEAERMGLEIMVGMEVEFYLFYTDDSGNPTTSTHDHAGFCDLTPLDLGENVRRDMVLTLEEMGIEVGFSHHEKGPGQHGITLKPDSALVMADKLVTFKFIVRTIAQRYGLHASFMPRPLNDRPGSAMILHLYLRPKGAGFINGVGKPLPPGREAGHFVAGILAHARANAAITNPLVNSYKRLFPGDLTMPVHVAWSEDSRHTVLRVAAHPGRETRVEVRNPDPACNPYLALALILKAGLEGMRQQLQLPPPLNKNILLTDDGQCKGTRPACLPRTLDEALRELACDQVARATLGEYIYRIYARAKAEEWERFQIYVHPWELQEYLLRF
ncbi:glutamine synthetase [Desulfofundulus australicus DSM 11792]|uniref:Glutamine synthetase n=1 Tax=Desulfofundulus australicus DSM 11792 TaxID=1121425 RepID=A0A1M4ZVJ1_9FIRM|nr:glutamine synthetase family protein [Desulfofundulus australicus]SHF21772.1 glutamine synthetase [Desulfofundulus australicus DSM 11792]